MAGLAVATAIVAARNESRATQQERVALSRELIANVEKVLERDPQLSLSLIKKAASIEKTEQVSDALVAYVRAPGRAVLHHSDTVWSAAFSADGQRVVTASEDSTARIWDAGTGKQLAELRGHLGWVSSAAFSADGQRVVTASYDSTARIRDVSQIVPTQALQQQVLQQDPGRDFTCAERRQYLHEECVEPEASPSSPGVPDPGP